MTDFTFEVGRRPFFPRGSNLVIENVRPVSEADLLELFKKHGESAQFIREPSGGWHCLGGSNIYVRAVAQ